MIPQKICGSGIAVFVCATLLAGCQSSNSERPLLPLIRPIQVISNDAPKVVRGQTAEPRLLPELLLTENNTKEAPEKIDVKSSPIILSCFVSDHAIDLDTALRLANMENPTIGLAEEVVQANLAERMIARSLLFPTLNLGTTYAMHQGSLLRSRGVIIDVDRQSLFFGGGADVRGGGTVAVPGVQLVSHLGDAFYAPRVAEQKVISSQFDAAASRNNILLDVAMAYLALVGAEARILAYQQSESEFADVVKLTANFAAIGQGRESDAQRARSSLHLLQSSAQQAEEEVVLWTTELSRLLSTDTAVRLRPELGTPPLIQLVDSKITLAHLLETALAQRPEIAARSTDVILNETRLRQELVRPFVPTIAIGMSAGDFGGGSDLVPYRFGHFSGRTDVDVLAVWTLQNMGLGNRAIQHEVRAQIGQAEAQRQRMIEQVRREVAEASARTTASRMKMDIARRRVETSQQAYRQDLTRAKNLEGHLIEVLNSLNLLTLARQDLVVAMIGYSQTQFELFVALGGTPKGTRQEKAEFER